VIVVVHSSDIHVDNAHVPPEYAGDGTAGLRAVLDAARAVEAHAVLLAGDTFEHNRLPEALIARAARMLAEAGRPVVILPGNHDPATADTVHRKGGIAGLRNVHILGVTHEDSVTFDALGLEVWGNAHRDYNDMAPLGAAIQSARTPPMYGAHGYRPEDPWMGALLLAVGRGAPPGAELGELRSLDIAPTVLRLLGLEVPGSMEGRPIARLVPAAKEEAR